MADLTDWYPPSTPPYREGWYERLYGPEDPDDVVCPMLNEKDWFDGENWHFGYGHPTDYVPSPTPANRPWRGRKEPHGGT